MLFFFFFVTTMLVSKSTCFISLFSQRGEYYRSTRTLYPVRSHICLRFFPLPLVL